MNPRQTIKGKSFAQKGLRAFAFVLPVALAVLPIATATSEAASICRQIQHQLAAAAPPPRRDAKALDRAVRESRAAGCGPTGFASTHDTHCRVHAHRIHDLQSFAFVPTDTGRDGLRRERARLTAALRANGCVGQPTARKQVVERVVKSDRAGSPILTVDGSIPVPTPRPASPAELYQARYVEHSNSRVAALDIARAQELVRPRAISPDRQAVRVVGGRFLAEPDGEMDFMVIAYSSESPANGILAGLLAAIEGTIVSSAVAAER